MNDHLTDAVERLTKLSWSTGDEKIDDAAGRNCVVRKSDICLLLSALRDVPEGWRGVECTDLATEIGRKLEDDFPNYAMWPIELPAGHWRFIRAMISASPPLSETGGTDGG